MTSEARETRQTALAIVYQRDPRRRDDVVASFLPLVRHLAGAYRRGEEPLDDLVQVACVGLIKALQRFDETRGGSFHAFAVPTITGELRRHYRDTGWSVHVPRDMKELAQRVSALERQVAEETGRTATADELGSRLGVDARLVSEARVAGGAMRALRLDPVAADGDDHACSLEHLGVIDPGFEAAEGRAVVASLTAGLSLRERMLLVLRFGTEDSQTTIGERVGASRGQVARELQRLQSALQTTVAAEHG